MSHDVADHSHERRESNPTSARLSMRHRNANEEPVRGLLGMVARDMSVRFRLLLAFAAVAATISVLALIDASVEGGAAPEDHVAFVGTSAQSAVALAARPNRPAVLRADGQLPRLLGALAAGLLAVGVRLRNARRIADVGDAWRSLLYGAPPAQTA